MNFDPMTPIWVQVAHLLQTDMVTGRLGPGEKLPSGRELAVRYTINPNTAARIYQKLEAQGLCEVKRGLGTFVTEDGARIDALRKSLAGEAVKRFLTGMDRLGVSREDAVRMIMEEGEEHA